MAPNPSPVVVVGITVEVDDLRNKALALHIVALCVIILLWKGVG
jgi:hypothetical protein